MSERYSKLFALPQNLYSECAPVLIAAGALLKDNETGKVLAQLKIQNIQNNTIKAATVKIVPLDTVGKPLGNEVEHQYLDLNATRDMDFGQKSPILLPDPATRAFSVSIAEVIFTDNSIWTATETWEETLATPVPLTQALGDSELVTQYNIEYGADCKSLYKEEKDLWWCACGALNHQDEPLCHRCQKKAADLAALDLERLKTERDARLKAEQKKAAEEKAAATVRTKKATKIAMIAAPIIVVAIAAGMLISDNIQKNSAYGDAMELMDAGNYEEAITAFESLGNYKDSEEQCEIATAKRYPAKALCDFIREKGTHEEQISLPNDTDFAGYAFDVFSGLDREEQGDTAFLYAEEDNSDTVWYQCTMPMSYDNGASGKLIFSVCTSCVNGETKLDYFCTITDNVTLPDDTTANTRFSGSVDAASYTSNTTIQIATMSVESWTAASLSQPTRYPVDPTMKQAYQETANSLMKMFMNHFSNAVQKNTDTTMVDLGFSKELEESLTNK